MGKRGTDDDEDAALWAKVVETAAPLKRKQPAPSNVEKPAPPVPQAKPKAPPPPQKAASPAPPKRPPPASKAPLDRRTARELEKGMI
jgi:hypothetical protein